MSDEASEFQEQLTALQGQVSALESQVSALQDQVTALQAGGDSEDDEGSRPYGGVGP